VAGVVVRGRGWLNALPAPPARSLIRQQR
jgi:hypothetical protein